MPWVLSKPCCCVMLILYLNLCVASGGKMSICPEKWSRFLFVCYHAYAAPLSFLDADNFCYELGGKLVALSSEIENDYVTSLLVDAAVSEAHIGLMFESGAYMWDEYTPVNYTNWKNEPDRKDKFGPNCVTLHADDGKWYTGLCSAKLPYVCEKDLQTGKVCNLNGEEFDLQPREILGPRTV